MTGHSETLESRLFRNHWNHGLLDLFAGFGSAAIGVLWALDLVVFGAIVPALLLPLWQPLYRRIVEPRAGLVEFSEEREGRNRRLLAGTAWLGAGVLVGFVALWRLAAPADWISLLIPGLPAFLLAILAAIVGVGLGLARFLGYAAVFCVAGMATALAGAQPAAAMIAGGVVILANAARLLIRFRRTGVEDGGDA